MNAQTTTDLQAARQEIEARIGSTADALADAVTVLGQAVTSGADAELIAEMAKQAKALSDHLQSLRRELAATDQAIETRRTIAVLRDALAVATRAADELPPEPAAVDAGPAILSPADPAAPFVGWPANHMRPTIYS